MATLTCECVLRLANGGAARGVGLTKRGAGGREERREGKVEAGRGRRRNKKGEGEVGAF